MRPVIPGVVVTYELLLFVILIVLIYCVFVRVLLVLSSFQLFTHTIGFGALL
jgi:hypothetical protein